jgi:hypothetical protein
MFKSNDHVQLFAIGGSNSVCVLDTVEIYSSTKDKWEVVKRFGEALGIKGLKSHQAVALPDGIMVMGGFDGDEFTSKVWKIDTKTLKISQLPSMNIARASFKTVLSNNCHFIYAIGGFNDSAGPLSSVERFDLLSQSWSIISPMNHARFGHACHNCLSYV